MSNKDLKGNSHKVRGEENAWWYEEVQGMSVVVHRDAIKVGAAAIINIPWKQIRAALERKDRQVKR